MRTKSGPATIVVLVIVLLPAVYVLSAGPVVWLHSRGALGGDSPIWLIYWPLEVAAENWSVFEAVLIWYLHFWDPANF